jgi:hypothetical protein
MKPYQLAVIVLFTLFVSSVHAQVTNFSVFKVTVYQQTCGAPPTSPDFPYAYYFGAQLNASYASDFGDVYVVSPGIGREPLTQLTPTDYNFGSPYYADETNFDNDYPGGDYLFVAQEDSDSESGNVIVPDNDDLYATNAAAFTTNCWNAMQQVDPSQDFELDWNSFVPSTNATSAFTFVDVLDPSNNTVFAADFLTPDTMTTNIPAGTLLYGTTYQVNAFFSTRVDTPDAGFGGALGTVGFDNLTYTTLVTIPPWLTISGAKTNMTLFWPSLATNYVLVTTTQLSGDSTWAAVTNIPCVMGATNELMLPMDLQSQFFRLSPLSSM